MIPKIEAGPTRQRTGRKVVDLKPKQAVRRHAKLSLEDLNWFSSQSESVRDLYMDCLAAEQFGKQLRQLETNLNEKFFRRAKAVIEKQGLFRFEPIVELSPAGRLRITGWKVENLHGYRYKNYWEVSPVEQNDSSGQYVSLNRTICQPQPDNMSASTGQYVSTSSLGLLPDKGLNFANQGSTTPQLPTKVVEGRVSIPSEETEPPLEGVVPTGDGIPEEESPTATDETAIASDAVEEVSTESSTSPQNQAEEAGRKPNDSLEDHSSAAPAAAKTEAAAVTSNQSDPVAELEEIYELAIDHGYRLEEAEKEELNTFTPAQLTVVAKQFQLHMAKYSCLTSKGGKKDRFGHALRMGRYLLGYQNGNDLSHPEASRAGESS